MSSCRDARASILAVVRQQATDADKLRLEEHLAICERCRAEKAKWRLMERLRDEPPQHLGDDARQRVLRHLTTLGPAEVGARERRRPRLLVPALLGAATVAAVALLARDFTAPPAKLAPPPSATAPRAEVNDQTIAADAPGTLEVPGLRIAYPARTTFRLLEQGRRVELYAGEVEIEVAGNGRGPFRVVAPRFIVEVVGTGFVVRLDGVATRHGTVRVTDARSRELAVLGAGQRWDVRDPCELPVALTASGSPPLPEADCAAAALSLPLDDVKAPTSAQRPRASAPGRRSDRDRVDDLLADARRALARRDAEQARANITKALAGRASSRQRAAAGVLTAASYLIERRYDEAMAAYRRTAETHARHPEGETAAFAMAQLVWERASPAEARAALRAYLDRYPEGRFAADARRKLASLP